VADWQKLIDSVFGQPANKVSANEKSNIKPAMEQLAALEAWNQSESAKELKKKMADSWYFHLQQIPGYFPAKTFMAPGSEALVFSLREAFSLHDYEMLLLHYRQIILAGGYKATAEECTQQQKLGSLVLEHKRYLKPQQASLDEIPFNQKFGNILLVLHAQNGNPEWLKIQANFYTGHNYSQALTFRELPELLFSFEA